MRGTICCAPRYMTRAPTTPRTTVEESVMQRLRGEGADDVVEQALDAAGKDAGLALFGVVALDDAHAAERFGEAAGDFGVDLAALAEDGADGLEGLLQDEGEDDQDDRR